LRGLLVLYFPVIFLIPLMPFSKISIFLKYRYCRARVCLFLSSSAFCTSGFASVRGSRQAFGFPTSGCGIYESNLRLFCFGFSKGCLEERDSLL
jgi:hypothetical protein